MPTKPTRLACVPTSRNFFTGALRCLLAGAALFGATLETGSAQVLYRQVFGNSTGGNRPLSDVAWVNYLGNTANLNGANNLASSLGKPTDLGNVNSSVTATSQTNGNFFAQTPINTAGNGIQIAIASAGEVASMNSQLGAPISLATNLQFSWYSANDGGNNSATRLVLQIDNGVNSPYWIVSNTPKTTPYSVSFNSSAALNTVDFSFAASSWSVLNFTPGSTLTIGSTLSSDLGSATITGFGILATNTNTTAARTMRFDTFQIASVPEPSVVMMAGCGMVLMIARRRRTQRR